MNDFPLQTVLGQKYYRTSKSIMFGLVLLFVKKIPGNHVDSLGPASLRKGYVDTMESLWVASLRKLA